MTPLTVTVFAQAITAFPVPDAASRRLLDAPPRCEYEGTDLVRCRCHRHSKERSMANNKNPNQKQPGEKEPGKFHYNPGNMSGKTIGKNESQQRANADTKQSRREHKDQKR
jgi:hypothetical protein